MKVETAGCEAVPSRLPVDAGTDETNGENPMKEVELFLVWNEDGDMEADTDVDLAIERLAENFGGSVRREMKITVKFPLPKPIEATITLPETADIAVVEI